jgi:hypothetical protein
MNWKIFGKKHSWPDFKVLSWHLPGCTEEKHENPQDSHSPGWDLILGPLEYEARVLTTWPRYSVEHLVISTVFQD